MAHLFSRRHAAKLVTLLNEEAARRHPAEYGEGSAFAAQVTSDIAGAQRMTIDFANNNLNGKSKWRAAEFPDYDTSRTRVCVTVGMMTTGYDCEDVLNVVLARPMFSPTDFIQVKGRGTRLFTFKHEGKSEKKDGFAIFDFFANCEYFEKDFKYDDVLKLPKPKGDGGGGDGDKIEEFTSTSLDPVKTVATEKIGDAGMRIDREMYRERFSQQAGKAVGEDAALREAFEKFAATTETNATHSRELRTVFVAFLLDPASRRQLESGKFAELRSRDPNLFASLQNLDPPEREKLIGYLRSDVPLGVFQQAA